MWNLGERSGLKMKIILKSHILFTVEVSAGTIERAEMRTYALATKRNECHRRSGLSWKSYEIPY